MIDREKLEKVMRSFVKTNKNASVELYELLTGGYIQVQTGLMSANDITQVKYLQGFGSAIAIFLDALSKTLIGGETTDG